MFPVVYSEVIRNRWVLIIFVILEFHAHQIAVPKLAKQSSSAEYCGVDEPFVYAHELGNECFEVEDYFLRRILVTYPEYTCSK